MEVIDLINTYSGLVPLLDVSFDTAVYDLHNEFYTKEIVRKDDYLLIMFIPSEHFREHKYKPDYILLYFSNIVNNNFISISIENWERDTCLHNFGKGEINDSNSETGYFFFQFESDDLIEIECKNAALIMI